jgi:hypothetical protein
MDIKMSQVRAVARCIDVLYEHKPYQYDLAFPYFATDTLMEQSIVCFAQRESGRRSGKLIMTLKMWAGTTTYIVGTSIHQQLTPTPKLISGSKYE